MFEILAGALIVAGSVGCIIWFNKRKEEKHYREELKREYQYYENCSYDQGCEID